MKCHQCERPAYYQYDQAPPLCLSCANMQTDVAFKGFLMNAAAANQALDDMEAVSGIRLGGGRIPVAALATVARAAPTVNSISITGSSVGVVNTGDLAKIEAVVTITQGSDAEQLGLAIRAMTQAVLDSNEVIAASKKDVVELLTALSEQIAAKRSKPVVGSILRSIEEHVRPINALGALFDRLASLVQAVF